MQTILRIITNTDDIRQEKLSEGPILSLNKRHKQHSLNKKVDAGVKESMDFKVLKK